MKVEEIPVYICNQIYEYSNNWKEEYNKSIIYIKNFIRLDKPYYTKRYKDKSEWEIQGYIYDKNNMLYNFGCNSCFSLNKKQNLCELNFISAILFFERKI